jgi:restriction system protein
MVLIPSLPPRPPLFVGRKRELEEIREALHWGHFHEVLKITGPAGVGKTALVREAFEDEPRRFRRVTPLWYSFKGVAEQIKEFDETLRKLLTGERPEHLRDDRTIIILDEVDDASEETLHRLERILFNYKRVRGLILISREDPPLRGHKIRLEGLSSDEKREILNRDLEVPLSYEQMQSLIEKAGDLPLALSLISGLLNKSSVEEVLKNLDGQVYDLKKSEGAKIIQAVRPQIVSFSDELIIQLKKAPDKLHEVNSRQFEHLIADLFHDMGWEVELTQATRDGGRDILAHLNTGVIKMLCLIEAKKHRKDRPVGVQLVRNLYGTFCDEQANSAMLVTSSHFTPEAKKLEARHKYQLALKDYTDVIEWLANYKTPAKRT